MDKKNREKFAMMFKYYISNDDTFDGAKWQDQDHVLVCSIVKTPTQPSLNLVGFDKIIAVKCLCKQWTYCSTKYLQ